MEIYRDCNNCRVQNTVLTVGMFDGVHAGHREILTHVVKRAYQKGGEPTLLTFWPHPRLHLSTNSDIKIVTTIDEKIELLKACGLHNLVILPFDDSFSKLTPKHYVKEILVDKLHVSSIIVGYDHRFGHRGEGNFELLQEYGTRYGFDVEEIPAVAVNNNNVSSTKIRQALQQGEIEIANQYLTYRFHIHGRVAEGKKIGRTIGFPTANVQIDNLLKIIPANGVYIVEVLLAGHKYKGVANIGTNPTIDINNQIQTIEVFLFDFNRDIYGAELRVDFLKRIREQKRFSGIDELTVQIAHDVQFARQFFGISIETP